MNDDAQSDWDLAPVITWLLEEGRFAEELDGLVAGLGAALLRAGAPLDRLRLGMRTLHPLSVAVSAIWHSDRGVAPVDRAAYGLEHRSSYVGSPMEAIARENRPFRHRFDGPLDPDAHGSLHDLAALGMTDYYGLPMRYVYGGAGLMLSATRRAGGFTEHDITNLNHLAAALAPVLEAYRLSRLSLAVSEAYLGPRSAARVLGGEITRGHVEEIDAAIMVSDLRGWTALNTQRPPAEALDLVNRYYDILDTAITAQDGEILKFMGDGVLAVFPDPDATAACTHALAAATSALDAAADLEAAFGIALHHGRVQFGNIGAAARLDFTVMGHAVNYAARLEPYTKVANIPLVLSADVAQRVAENTIEVGTAEFKGVPGMQRVFALSKDADARQRRQ